MNLNVQKVRTVRDFPTASVQVSHYRTENHIHNTGPVEVDVLAAKITTHESRYIQLVLDSERKQKVGIDFKS